MKKLLASLAAVVVLAAAVMPAAAADGWAAPAALPSTASPTT
jgi:hypothetical protein